MAAKRFYGWKRGLPQRVTHKYFPMRGATALPGHADLTSGCPGVYDQGQLGSCTANAGSALAEFLMKKVGHPAWMPSRLALYYWTRVLIEGNNPGDDSGCSLADTMKSLNTFGVAHESMWWYDINKFSVKPSAKVVADAASHVVLTGESVNQDLFSMRSVLAEGYPFIFGFTVYDSFENDIGSNGIMPMPKPGEQVLGGHAVMAVGYDDSTRRFKVRNSWGAGWGAGGYFFMPYDFITDTQYADDMWTSHNFSVWK